MMTYVGTMDILQLGEYESNKMINKELHMQLDCMSVTQTISI